MKHLKEFKEKMYSLCDKFCRALGHKIGIHYNKNDDIDYDEMEIYANKINHNYAFKDKSDDFEIDGGYNIIIGDIFDYNNDFLNGR